MLTKDALERKPETQGGAFGGRIEIVAFPFVATITKIIEDVASEQILRFRRADRALHRRRIKNVADFDHPMLRVDAQERLVADGFPAGVVDDREKQRVFRLRLGFDIGAEDRTVGIGTIEEIGPTAILVAAVGAIEE